VLAVWLVVLPAATAGPLIVGVLPTGPAGSGGLEAFALGSNEAADVSGWKVTDGEGWLTMPEGTTLQPGDALWIVSDLGEWRAFGGAEPAMAWPPAINPPKLADGGDDLHLLDLNGRDASSVSWGTGRTDAGPSAGRAGPATLLMRDEEWGWSDTGAAKDWATPRIHKLGESSLDAPTFAVHDVTLYASPDNSFQVLASLIGASTRRLHLHVYELTSAVLADALVSQKAAHPSLDLEVLVDGAPVGLLAPERHAEADALRRIQAAGGRVVLAGSARYDHHHLKVLLADDAVAVQSENWVDTGVPRDPSYGNRGWGVAVQDAALATWFAAWMAEDRDAWDARLFALHDFDPLFQAPDRTAPRAGEYRPTAAPLHLLGDFSVTPLVSPDATQDPRRDPLARLIESAQTEVDTQQLEIEPYGSNASGWNATDPLLSSLAGAADRGVGVRVQVAAPFSLEESPNGPGLDWLAAHGVATSVMARPGIVTLHNKGLLVDDVAVVGSMNGNAHSRRANREVDLVLRGPGVARYFRGLFDADWSGTQPEPARDFGVITRDLHAIPAAPVPIIMVAVAVAVAIRVRTPCRSTCLPSRGLRWA
jgi:cardiolipin synthase